MPIFINNKRVQLIYKGETPIEEIHAQNQLFGLQKQILLQLHGLKLKSGLKKGLGKNRIGVRGILILFT